MITSDQAMEIAKKFLLGFHGAAEREGRLTPMPLPTDSLGVFRFILTYANKDFGRGFATTEIEEFHTTIIVNADTRRVGAPEFDAWTYF